MEPLDALGKKERVRTSKKRSILNIEDALLYINQKAQVGSWRKGGKRTPRKKNAKRES